MASSDLMNVDSMNVDPTQPEVLFQFYHRLPRPFENFTHREFSATLIGDVYLRYHSWNTLEEFKQGICRLNPTRFEIGAIYNLRPKDKKSLRPGALQPLLRELVFDIDMTDYDEIRTCCSGKGICKRCWGFISAAVRVLDNALREQFGYKHLLWVYSGRRGIHCWISDESAMALTDDQRRTLMSYLEVVKGSKDKLKKVNVRPPRGGPLHPALARALRLLNTVEGDQALDSSFDALILQDQNVFEPVEKWEELLKLIGDSSFTGPLSEEWSTDPDRDSKAKWKNILAHLKKREHAKRAPIMHALEDIILQHMYPRLDMEVSKHRNHLLKAPFCVHPATGRICVPVDPKAVDDFDPETVPTIGQLLAELNNSKKPDDDGTERFDWERTSLKPYVDMLQKHSQQVQTAARHARQAQPKLEY
ncbi:hypothetical protein BKA62DRAFT_720381 [Auriculariales sp. MPI-PUGE-AT-0066]|nr:hypothetical protein BKA62DRAFT_720381 [Auriculariales sp. MPI-PUGE-AT-0066]